ncbi:cytochrome c oxidase polypeptide mitochondrial precursor [Moniliophthora roreri]|uniref:C2H2-type domain-containing protein n=1 Tax=Moniliophthora roreri TaxID=221103 RepID=A0A0W0EXW9_MONRR|nr:cytochrome c oxidase polypeptide mitochondrial precursor [Moniliophthora roreri]
MFSRAIAVARPAAKRAVTPTVTPACLRAFSVSARTSSGGHGPPPPQIFGPGVKPGEVPGIHEQSTGLERLQHLGELEGIPVFDTAPLDSSRVGTKQNPILVPSASVERLVGCTGSPADSHDVLWFALKKGRQHRCTECGSVYQMDFYGEEHHDHHHH